MCHSDEATAIDRGIDGSHFFGYSLAHYYVFGQHQPGVTNVWEEFEENRERFGFSRDIAARTGQVLGAQLMEQGLGSLRGAVGTPAQIRELVRAYEEAGVDQLIFVSQAGRNRHEDVCESLELFAREVMPEFTDRVEAAEAIKARRMAPAVEAALARRDPPRPAPADYSFPATPAF
jgi:alkanesulfonate monooxygenase SsuD/methylene tetrahydromethanopterin reductase-like flavin-dependent oxidoreductase (luciferase family)